MNPRTCAVIVDGGDAAATLAGVRSLRESETPVRLVLVERGADGAGIASELAAGAPIELVSAPAECGFEHAANLGLQAALSRTDCEFLFLCADISVQPDAVLMLEDAMDKRGDADAMTGRIVFADDPERLYYARGSVDWKRAMGRVPGFGGSSLAQPSLYGKLVNFAPACALVLRRAALEDIGGFDETFCGYDADVDLSMRLIEHGHRIFFCADADFAYHGSRPERRRTSRFAARWSAQAADYDASVFYTVRNAVLNARRHARGAALATFLVCFPLLAAWHTTGAVRRHGLRAYAPLLRGAAAGLKHPRPDAV